MDYDLHRLNSRSFEQLVQALALKFIGPSVTVFGDGPDGGREATWDGAVASKSVFSESGLLQAKFRQTTSSGGSNWVIGQLRKELAPFRARQRPYPESYVFATNVRLSSVAGTGGKDRALQELATFAKASGRESVAYVCMGWRPDIADA